MDEHTVPLKINQMWFWKKHPNDDNGKQRYLINKQFPNKVLDMNQTEEVSGWRKVILYPEHSDYNQKFERQGDEIQCPGYTIDYNVFST